MTFGSINFILSSLKWYLCFGFGQLIEAVGGGDPSVFTSYQRQQAGPTEKGTRQVLWVLDVRERSVLGVRVFAHRPTLGAGPGAGWQSGHVSPMEVGRPGAK